MAEPMVSTGLIEARFERADDETADLLLDIVEWLGKPWKHPEYKGEWERLVIDSIYVGVEEGECYASVLFREG